MDKITMHLENYSPLLREFQTLQILDENKTIIATFGYNMTGFTENFYLRNDKNEIIISGDSAWCPCLELFTKISKKYPSFEIHYEYEEPGCDFAGFAEIAEGNCNDNQFTYWEGKAVNDYDYAFQSAFEDVSCYCDETEEDFIESDLYKAFKPEEQKELLEEFQRMTAEQKETEETDKYKEIEEAKELLKQNGYYTDNLWHVNDVKAKFVCTDEEAQAVLHDALENDATMEQIHFAIGWHGEELGLEKIDEIDEN